MNLSKWISEIRKNEDIFYLKTRLLEVLLINKQFKKKIDISFNLE